MYAILYYFITSIVILTITMWIRSTNILIEPLGNTHTETYYMEPTRINYFESEHQLPDIIMNIYKNCIFNIVYYRIRLPGVSFKYYGLGAIRVLLVLMLFNIVKFIIQFIKFLLFRNGLSFHQFIYLNFDNRNDGRAVLFIDGTWVCNP